MVSEPDDSSMITITAVAEGTATITVTASDGTNPAVSQEFDVTVTAKPVVVNNPPTSFPFPNLTLDKVGDTQDITLSAYYRDETPSADLAYTAESDDTKVASVTKPNAASTITIEAVGFGKTKITVTGSDGVNDAVARTFEVTVRDLDNLQPKPTDPIPDINDLKFGDSREVDLSMHFTDDDDDDDSLIYTAVPAMEGYVTTDVDDSVVKITVADKKTGSTRIDVTVSDGKHNNPVKASFVVTVVNQAPESTTNQITNLALDFDEETTFSLVPYFRDPEGRALEYGASIDDDKVATVSVDDSDNITITAKDDGNATITITATDDGDNTTSRELALTVRPEPTVPNNAPTTTAIPAMSLDLGSNNTANVTLSDHFSDEDGDELTYVVSSDNEDVATAAEAAGILTVTATSSGVGNATITVTASDPDGAEAELTFVVTVSADPNNERPVHDVRIGDRDLQEGGTLTITLSDHFRDQDGDELTYGVSSDNEDVATAAEADGELTITAVAKGTAKITVTASDGKSRAVEGKFNVTVAEAPPPPNGAPTASDPIPNLGLTVGDTQDLNLSSYFDDPDGDDLTYAAESSMETYATAEVDESTLTIEALEAGKATITVTASDPDGAEAEQTFVVTVSAVPNEAPAVKGDGIPNQSLEMDFDDATKDLDLSMYFEDPDGDDEALTYAAESSMPENATATVENSTLTIAAVKAGEATVTVTASDGEDEVSDTFTVTVSNPDVPTDINQLADQTFASDDTTARTFTLSKFFSMATMYEVSSSPSGIVTAEEADGVLTLTPVKAGIAVVTVVPSNSGGNGSAQTITVTVESVDAPKVLKPILAQTLVSDAMMITLSEYYSNATAYDVMSTNTSVVTAAEAEGVLTLTPVSHGSALVSVTASNAGGNATTHFFNVTVKAKPALKTDMMFEDVKVQDVADAEVTEATLDLALKKYDLSDYVTDPDGNSLTFSTKTSDATIVAVYKTSTPDNDDDDNLNAATEHTKAKLDKATSEVGPHVTLRGRKEGSATVTIKATDADKLVSEWSVKVTVVETNTAPVVAGVTFPGADESTNPYQKFAQLNTNAGKFKSTETTPKRLKIDLSTLFDDPDVESNQRTTGDSWTFKAVSGDDDVVTVTLESTNESTKPDEYEVVLTRTGSGSTTVHFEVTDSFGETIGSDTTTQFPVVVNTAPKAEGAQASADPVGTPQTLAMLSARYADLAVATAFSTVTNADGTDISGANSVTLVAENSGYFMDEDTGDTLTCRYDTRGDDIFAENFPAWVSAATRVAINLGTDEGTALAKKGTAHIDVWCTDAVGESSPKATLTIKVMTTGSRH